MKKTLYRAKKQKTAFVQPAKPKSRLKKSGAFGGYLKLLFRRWK